MNTKYSASVLLLLISFTLFAQNPSKNNEIDELEAELLMLQEKKSEKDSIEEVEQRQYELRSENSNRLSDLNMQIMEVYSSNEFSLMENIYTEGIALVESLKGYDCYLSADFIINMADYLTSKGEEDKLNRLVSMVPESCEGVSEYARILYLNSVGRFEEANQIFTSMGLIVSEVCFKSETTKDDQIACYQSIKLYPSVLIPMLLNVSNIQILKQNVEGALNYAHAAFNIASVQYQDDMKFATSLTLASLYFSQNEVGKAYEYLNLFEDRIQEFPTIYQKEYYRLMTAIADTKGDESESLMASDQMSAASAEMEELQTVEQQLDKAFRLFEMQRSMDIFSNGIFSNEETSLDRLVRELEENGNTNSFYYVKAVVMLAASSKSDWSFDSKSPIEILKEKLKNVSTRQYRLAILRELAELTFQDLDDSAFGYLEEMRTIAGAVNSKVAEFQATSKLAFLHDMYDMNEEALKFYQLAINDGIILINEYYPFLTETEQFYFNAKWIQPLERSAFTFSLKSGLETTALNETLLDFRLKTKSLILENSSRTRLMVEHLENEEINGWYDELRKLKEGLSTKQDELSWSEKSNEVKRIEALEEKIQVRLGLESSISKDVSLNDIKESLTKNEVAVEIVRLQKATGNFLTDSISYLAFVVSKNESLRRVVFPSPHLMENTGFDFYLRTIKFKIEDNRSYSEFWAPLEPYMSNVNRVYLSSDGVFNGVNIGALKNPKTDKYLYEHKSIVQLSSLRDLVNRKLKREIKSNESIFVGRPKYFLTENGQSSKSRGALIADLPGTEKEVITITEKLETKEIPFKNYLGTDASEGLIKELKSPRVLHVATHGFFDQESIGDGEFDSPMLSSGLLMSGAGEGQDFEGQDGILSAYEITGINLTNTNLVVLSACESGIGENRDGQGVYGLSRAFFIAGAETVIASLWKVDDDATQKFMAFFYDHWLDNYNVSEAMDFARNSLKKEYPQPYYWAAFVATGGF